MCYVFRITFGPEVDTWIIKCKLLVFDAAYFMATAANNISMQMRKF